MALQRFGRARTPLDLETWCFLYGCLVCTFDVNLNPLQHDTDFTPPTFCVWQYAPTATDKMEPRIRAATVHTATERNLFKKPMCT